MDRPSESDSRPLLHSARLNTKDADFTEAQDTAQASSLAKSSWVDTISVLIGLIMGSGSLGLPSAMTHLGWVCGMLVSVLFGLTAIYSGVLLSYVRNNFLPQAENYNGAAGELIGYTFKVFTKICIWMNWAFLLAYYIVAITNSLEMTVGGDLGICFPYWNLVVIAILILPLQLRTFNALAWLGTSSGVAIVLSIFIMFYDFAKYKPADQQHVTWSVWPKEGVSFLQIYGSTAQYIFAYQGQSVFFEVMREMKTPKKFPHSVGAANFIMMLVYSLISGLSYYFKGDYLDTQSGFLPNSVTNRTIKIIVGCLVTFNLISAYLLTNIPLAIAFHDIWDFENSRDHTSWKGRLQWLVINACILTFGFVMTNLVPNFKAFQSIIGSAFGAPIMFGWPALFMVAAHLRFKRQLGVLHAAGCACFLVIFLPSCMGLGLTNAIKSLLDSWNDSHGSPFMCNPPA
eukprot:m.432789 g.432789  ORF g.432789 m.432789 type:complete len:457 (-) comp21414_c1_seq6:171-1541(-)